jgi:thiol-disulfide isomerase/thioredoxin
MRWPSENGVLRPLLMGAVAVILPLAGLLSLLRYGEPLEQQLVAAQPDSGAVPTENPYPGRFDAPDLDGGGHWLNTSGPISLKDLRGKVVILDFWTYCCINCIHILPDLKYLEEKYPDQLVVIGVHAAKFDNEKLTENIRDAVLRYEIAHPVVNDSEMTIARKYFFSSWPTVVVIDPEGKFVGRISGEGQRELLDHVVGQLAAYHRAKGTLDETPVRFDLERGKQAPTPLRFPGKIVTDEPGNRLFISDSNNNRIVITTLNGELLDIVGNGGIGHVDGAYATAQFDHPQGMVLVGDTLYVADTENHLLRTIDLAKKTVGTLAGTGEQSQMRDPGGALLTTAINSPWDLTHVDGTLYIAMAGPHQLWKHVIGSKTLEVFAGNGREDIIDGTLRSSALAQPSGITHNGKTLYFVDSEGSAVRRASIGPGGEVSTIVGAHDLPRGASLFEFADIDGVGDAARLQHPIGLVYHDNGLFVADTYNHKIKRVDLKSRQSTTWLGAGQRGTSLSPVQLNEPAGLAIARGQLYIADTNNHRLLVTDLASKATRELTIAGLTPPNPPQKTTDDSADLTATNVGATAVRSGAAAEVVLSFKLPEGFKLNPLANVLWKLDAVGEQSVVASEQLGIRQEATGEGTTARFELPIAAAGKGTFDLTVTYQYCRDGAGGVCKLGRAKFRVPLTAAADAAAAPLNLTVTP